MTIDHIQDMSKLDEQYKLLFEKVKNNSFASNKSGEHHMLKEYYNVKDRLCIIDSILIWI